jgi:sulfur carrier protein
MRCVWSSRHSTDEINVAVAAESYEQMTVAGRLQRLGFPEKGIAVAVDWSVIPRSQWHKPIADGAKVEVVTAVQGG